MCNIHFSNGNSFPLFCWFSSVLYHRQYTFSGLITCIAADYFFGSLFLVYLEPNITGLFFRFIETRAITTTICFNSFDLTILLAPERLYYIIWKYFAISVFPIGYYLKVEVLVHFGAKIDLVCIHQLNKLLSL